MNNLSQIDTNSTEGKYLMAAMAMLTTESHTSETPYDVLSQVHNLAVKMYGEIKEPEVYTRPDFKTSFTQLLNSYSMENHSDTPDFILMEYLCDCFMAFNRATNDRERWYGRKEPHPQQAL